MARLSDTDCDWMVYKRLRNLCTNLQRKDRSKFLTTTYADMETENDIGRLYGLTKQLLGWNDGGTPTTFLVDGSVVTKQQDLANVLVDFYKNKVHNIKDRIPRVRTDPMRHLHRIFARWRPAGRIPDFKICLVTQREVFTMI